MPDTLTDSICLRTVRPDDLPALVTLLNQSTRTSLAAATRAYERIRAQGNFVVRVAESSSRLVGTYGLMAMDNLGHDGAPVGIVENVVVDAAWRRRGLGRALMDDAVAHARAAGCYKLVLASNDALREAHAFYEALGFARQGVAFSLALAPPQAT